VRKLGLVAWALAGTLLTYAAYFFACGMQDAAGALALGAAVLICLLTALVVRYLVRSVNRAVLVSGTLSFPLIALALWVICGLVQDAPGSLTVPVVVLAVLLSAPMVLTISYAVVTGPGEEGLAPTSCSPVTSPLPDEQPQLTDQATLTIAHANGTTTPMTIEYSLEGPCFMAVLSDSGRRYEGDDMFECLKKLRKELENVGARVVCNGARVDCYPSGMQRDMGGGLGVTIMRKGRDAVAEDQVLLFGDCPVDLVGTVEEQEACFHDWIAE